MNCREDILGGYENTYKIATDEKDLLSMSFLGEHFLIRGDNEKAKEIFTEIVQSNSEDPIDLFAMGKCYHLLNDRKKSIETYERALDCPFTYGHLGICYQHGVTVEKDIKKALEFYTIGIEKKDPVCMYLKGLLLLEGDEEGAMSLIDKSTMMGYLPPLIFLKGHYRNERNEKFFELLMGLAHINHVPSLIEYSMMIYESHPKEAFQKKPLLPCFIWKNGCSKYIM